MNDTIKVALIGVIATLFSGSGLIVALINLRKEREKSKMMDYKKINEHLSHDFERLNDIEQGKKLCQMSLENEKIKFSELTEKLILGLQIGLENDIVIFNALRTHHINGESAAQQKKVREYLINEKIS